MTQEEEVKSIGTYKIHFKTEFNKRSSDFINLKITYSRDLMFLLKDKAVIPTEIGGNYHNGSGETTFKRYKVRTPIMNIMSGDFRQVVFCKELLDNGNFTLKFKNVEYLNMAIQGFKENIKAVIKVILDYSDINLEVNFNIK